MPKRYLPQNQTNSLDLEVVDAKDAVTHSPSTNVLGTKQL